MEYTVEEWRPVVGYEGLYEVSNLGRVKSIGRKCISKNQHGSFSYWIKEKVLKQSFDRDGYYVVTLHNKDHEQKSHRVNRLVAEAFIPNPDNKPIVGHTKPLPDGTEDKTANEVWNLQWMTLSENARYGTLLERNSERIKKEYKEGKRKKVWEGKKRPDHSKIMSIPIIEIRDDGTVIEWEGGSTEYCRETGANIPNVVLAVNGKNGHKGHHYKTSQFYKKYDYEKMMEEQMESE